MRGDRVTANLPSRDLSATAVFYGQLGFEVAYQGADWLILERGDLELEFFPHPELDPAASWHSACIWVEDLQSLFEAWGKASLPIEGVPRLTPPQPMPSGLQMFALIDPDGNLLRCLELD